ncbi:hypothetical protein [Shimia abyssi]|uniref:Secreted protein (Por secretion system target) n=1 Tax=Shimia abyssi TaxID=1662395 RepID=A0A2P8FBY9_9RHOB|nr:hypothetical protein [Shimia abyssi]PSL19192.1 hypothetical protein CLV88_107135 [Shimia abyssi]
MRLNALFLSAVLCAPAVSATAQTSAISSLRTSADLFAIAQEQRDPLMMIAAAKLRKTVSLRATERAPTGGTAEAGSALDWRDMLKAASAIAADDEMMMELIEDVRVETTKGVADGPVYSVVTIGPRGTDAYDSLPFTGGAYAEVYIEGKGNSDLNLYVYDAQGRLVCSDTDISDIAYCGWRPATTGSFKLEVRNKGEAENRYALITN